ncbi:MAG: hypothetical protein QOG52_1589 [Frankiaceae bacterium]|nr:hypothetical protein [Frankiaceae bacterium]
MTARLVALLAAAAVALAMPPGGCADRLRVLAPHAVTSARRHSRWWAWLVPVVLILGSTGVLLMLSAAAARAVWQRDAPSRRRRLEDAQVRRAAPLAYDLLATCLEVALSLPAASRVVALSVGLPVAPLLDTLAEALERGASLQDAAGPMSEGPLADLGMALVAAESGGPGLGSALRTLAAEERAAAGAAARASAKRAGVWAVGPLTLCFLPAFVLVGVVPVVAGLLADLPH